MIDLSVRHFALPLRHPFTISRGTVSVQDTVIVQLHQDGLFGYGEATTNPYYGATVESLTRQMSAAAPLLRGGSSDDLDGLLAAVTALPGVGMFARCALDTALHDLWARRRGRPLHRLWGLDPAAGPLSDYTIGIDTPERMAAKLREVPEWPIYKIKLGTDRDLEIVRGLRRQTDKPFRVDANCGWTAAQAIEISAALADLGVEFIEQPLAADDPGMEEVYRRSALPVFADESCGVEADVDRCAGRFHGINIKLVKCGGLAAARRMIARARELGLQVMCGCMTESTVGISALAQLVPQLDHVDMDGAALLAADIATGVVVEGGRRRYPDRPGTGVELLEGPLPVS
ncbi:MAG: dipeptide epimerase [Planctomycetaceae bacterium]